MCLLPGWQITSSCRLHKENCTWQRCHDEHKESNSNRFSGPFSYKFISSRIYDLFLPVIPQRRGGFLVDERMSTADSEGGQQDKDNKNNVNFSRLFIRRLTFISVVILWCLYVYKQSQELLVDTVILARLKILQESNKSLLKWPWQTSKIHLKAPETAADGLCGQIVLTVDVSTKDFQCNVLFDSNQWNGVLNADSQLTCVYLKMYEHNIKTLHHCAALLYNMKWIFYIQQYRRGFYRVVYKVSSFQ